jgi:hypothetical protein
MFICFCKTNSYFPFSHIAREKMTVSMYHVLSHNTPKFQTTNILYNENFNF